MREEGGRGNIGWYLFPIQLVVAYLLSPVSDGENIVGILPLIAMWAHVSTC